MAKKANDVVIHRVAKKKTNAASPKKQNSDKSKYDKQFNRNIKVLAVCIMVISFFLLLALVSYTSADEAYINIKFRDLLGLLKANEQIIANAEQTQNWLGLFGAYISNYLYNYTFGYAVVLSPFILFWWAWDLFKTQTVSELVLKNTMLYLILGLLFAGIMGIIGKLDWIQGLPKEFSGIVGYYLASVLYSILGGIGALIVFGIGVIATLYYGFGVQFELFKNLATNVADDVSNADMTGLKKVANKISSPYQKLLEYTRRDAVVDIPEDEAQATNKGEAAQNNRNNRAEISNEDKSFAETARMVRQNVENVSHPGLIEDDFEMQTPNQPFVGIRDHSVPIIENETPEVVISSAKKVEPKIINPDLTPKTVVTPEIVDIKSINSQVAEAAFAENPEKIVDIIEPKKPETINIDLSRKVSNLESVADTLVEQKAEVFQINGSDPVAEPKITTNEENVAEQIIDEPILTPTTDKASGKPLELYVQDPVENDIMHFKPKSPISIMSLVEAIQYNGPDIKLLTESNDDIKIDEEELKSNAKILQEKLETFKIYIENLAITPGPVVTQYEFVPAAGIKISKICNLADDIAMALKAPGIRIISPIPGKGTVGIEIPNQNPMMVHFSSIIRSKNFHENHYKLPLALGKTISGEVYIADLAKMPHLLIAGSTGSGKSVGINTIICSLLYKMHPRDLKFVIIDPKKVELRQYDALRRHFLALSPDINETIITEPDNAVTVLKALCAEMDMRYDILASVNQRNIFDYNEKVREGAIKDTQDMLHRPMPYIVCVIDELADLMLKAGKDVETPIIRLAQLARAVGIHLVVATQRPSVDVITGIIKANFPARIAYLVASKIDSRTILDVMGAEQLLGNGDMLILSGTSPKPIRVQNAFISTDEVEAICDFIGNQHGFSEPYYLPSVREEAAESTAIDKEDRDPLFVEAAKLVIRQQTASVSLLQRRLKIGYARAGRIIDELEAAGVISQFDGSKSRSVYLESEIDLQAIL